MPSSINQSILITYLKGSAFLAPLDAEFATSVFQDFEKFLTENPNAIHTVVLWEFVPFGKILEVPQTATVSTTLQLRSPTNGIA
jgi:hypothetical protein